MYGISITQVLRKDPITKQSFIDVFARDELPMNLNYPCCFVLNTEPRIAKGGHWLAFYYDNDGSCDFFDSYGLNPAFFNLVNYLEKTSTRWKYNRKRIQGSSTYCGYYAILFLIFRCRNNSVKFFDNFSKNFNINDKLITKMIKEYE